MRKRPKPRPPLMRPCTERAVLTTLHHAMHRCGVPVEYWDREDMICAQALIREMRRDIWREGLCMPVIVEGMTVGEIVTRVVRAHYGRVERRSG